MTRRPRLSFSTLGLLHKSVEKPSYERASLATGQVHLGIGAFARAHIATYTDGAMEAKGGDWGIAAVSLRQRTVLEQLQPQDCLYTVAASGSESTRRRLVASIRSAHFAPEDPGAVIASLADPAVRVITVTVTEKGYCLAPDSGRLDQRNPDIQADLSNREMPRTALGYLLAAMRRRRDDAAPPLTVISCDNLPDNGRRLEAAVMEFADIAHPDLLPWIRSSARFPATMVDRIVPATIAADLDEGEAALGLRDEALVRAEPFSQWVIEDNFADSRPAWEEAGAVFVNDVETYERAKMGLLNGPHSALAYLGYLGGNEFIHEAMQNPDLVAYARHMMVSEISPVTPQPQGMAHPAYIEAVLHRFANSSMRHRTWQIAMDGSQKLPQRLLRTVQAQLHRGGPIAGLALAIAAWIRYTLGTDEDGARIDVRDPYSARFEQIAARMNGDTQDVVADYAQMTEIFGDELAGNPRFTTTVAGHLQQLLEQGSLATVRDFVATCGTR